MYSKIVEHRNPNACQWDHLPCMMRGCCEAERDLNAPWNRACEFQSFDKIGEWIAAPLAAWVSTIFPLP